MPQRIYLQRDQGQVRVSAADLSGWDILQFCNQQVRVDNELCGYRDLFLPQWWHPVGHILYYHVFFSRNGYL